VLDLQRRSNTLEEVITVVRRLLAGEEVTFAGEHVHFDNVQLEAPPVVVPPIIAGVSGPKSLAMAGRTADGLVLAEGTGPLALADALDTAAAPTTKPFSTTVFSPLSVHKAHITALGKAGAQRVSLFPAPIVEVARQDLETIGALSAALHG
jgi:5,10-methylenetetrahydromethanopterin reductase